MSDIDGIFNQFTIEIQVPTLLDDGHGNHVTVYPDEWATVDGVDMQVGATEQDSINRDGTSIDYTLFAPVDAPLTDDMQVRYQDCILEVVGRVKTELDPMGVLDCKRVLLREWKG